MFLDLSHDDPELRLIPAYDQDLFYVRDYDVRLPALAMQVWTDSSKSPLTNPNLTTSLHSTSLQAGATCPIPRPPCVDALLPLLALQNEKLVLRYVQLFLEVSIEKSRLCLHLQHRQSIPPHQRQYKMKLAALDNWRVDLPEVTSWFLGEPICDQSCLVPLAMPSGIRI